MSKLLGRLLVEQAGQRLRRAWTALVLGDVSSERDRQVTKWGVQSWPDFSPAHMPITPADVERAIAQANGAKERTDFAARNGVLTWPGILDEEVFEAYAEAAQGNTTNLREELVQVAAVCVAWIEDLDQRAQLEAANAPPEVRCNHPGCATPTDGPCAFTDCSHPHAKRKAEGYEWYKCRQCGRYPTLTRHPPSGEDPRSTYQAHCSHCPTGGVGAFTVQGREPGEVVKNWNLYHGPEGV